MKRAATHVETFRMRTYDLDAAGRVGLGAMCRYLQEAASNHAAALDVALERLGPLGLAWVLGRLHLRLERVPLWGEEIRVETWPSGRDALRATRDFLLLTESGEVFARATTAWSLVDFSRRRPVRLPDFVLEIVPPDHSRDCCTTTGSPARFASGPVRTSLLVTKLPPGVMVAVVLLTCTVPSEPIGPLRFRSASSVSVAAGVML